jgi:hypothetical protein
MAVGLSACATTVDNRVANSGPGLAMGAAVSVLVTEAPRSDLELAVLPRLTGALQKAGYAVTADAGHVVDFAFSARPAGLGVARSAQPSTGKTQQDWASPPQGRGAFSPCKKQTYRLVVTMMNKANGALVYHGASEMTQCPVSSQAAVDMLLTGALADLGAPGKSYVVKRAVTR